MTQEGLRIYYKVEQIRGEPYKSFCSVLKKLEIGDFELHFPGEQLDFEVSEIVPNSIQYETSRQENEKAKKRTGTEELDFFGYKIPKLGEEE